MLLIISVPNSKLAANKSKGWHWSEHANLRKQERNRGYYLAYEYCSKNTDFQNYSTETLAGIWSLSIHAYYKNEQNNLDDDNLLSALKNFRDGVFDYLKQKYNMNDRQIKFTILNTIGRDKKNPRIEWMLTPYNF